MAGYFRNDLWRDDSVLREEMSKFVRQGIHRKEMLDFLKRDFPQYAWSMPTLDRRLRHFEITYTDTEISVDEVKDAVAQELSGPGKLLGYRAMHKKIRQEHSLNVPRDLVHAVMYDLDPEGLKERAVGGKKKKAKGRFTSKGPNWVHSVDGHDKMMGYQNSTFPLAIYGCLDTASRKLLWLRIWTSNSDPVLIGRWYLDYLFENRVISSYIRMDKGTETGTMATMHAFLRRNHEDNTNGCDTVLYGPSTSNQIERWWKELHERLEKYFKKQLSWLKDENHYNPHDETHRMILAFVLIPLLQKELDTFKDTIWNTHRIRQQKETDLPHGVPNHIYAFPEEYGLEDCGWPVSEEELEKVADLSGVLEYPNDFLDQPFREECERLIPDVNSVNPNDWIDAFLYLRDNFNL